MVLLDPGVIIIIIIYFPMIYKEDKCTGTYIYM
jgi:hypothetical protein